MSLLNRHQRAVICVDTGVNELIVDRCVEAFDALLRGDVDSYKQLMATAWAQMGFGPDSPIRASDRPTALDTVKTICIRAYADREHISFVRAANKLRHMLES